MLEQINSVLTGAFLPIILILVGLYYGAKLNFFHIFKPLRVIRGLKNEGGKGGVSSAKAVTLALAGTLGVGNIVGVSSAIWLGGFGSVFWLWICALVAMILKYAEIVLAMRYRQIGKDGKLCGSAMNYIRAFLSSLGLPRVGAVVAAVFAVLFLMDALTMGSMLQTNAIAESLDGVLGIPPLLTGITLSLVTFAIVRKGTMGIAALTNVLVPIMSLGYVLMSLVVILSNVSELGDVFSLIFSSAFKSDAAVGGIGGYIFTRALRYGVMRGLVSNEAGCGTAPTAHAIAENASPAQQGLWGIFEVFVDTIILCTMTALVVILEFDAASVFGGNYMMMTIAAYAQSLGSCASYFLTVAVLCFGFATVLCWAHYGLTSARYLFRGKHTSTVFCAVYSLSVFLGSFVAADLAWQLSDLAMGAMTVINLSVIVGMAKEVKAETERLR